MNEEINIINEGENLNQILLDKNILKEGKVSYDATTNTLTLINATLEFPDQKTGIKNLEYKDPLTIKLIGISAITTTNESALINRGVTTIIGDKLFIDVKGTSADKAGILNSSNKLTIQGAKLEVNGGAGAGITGNANGDQFLFDHTHINTKGADGSMLWLVYHEFKECSITAPDGAYIETKAFHVVDKQGKKITDEVVITPTTGPIAILSVYPSTLNFDSEQEKQTIQVASEEAWELNTQQIPSWLKLSVQKGDAGIKDVVIEAEKNTTQERSVTLSFKMKEKTIQLLITQKGIGKKTVTGVELSVNEFDLKINTTTTLTAKVLPTDATNQKVTWKSDNPQIASVNENGEVKGEAKGFTDIHVITDEGKFTATCRVNVKEDDIPLEKLIIAPEITLEVKKKHKLTLEYKPMGATHKEVEWTSNNEKIAKVKDGEIEAISVGETTIVVTSKKNKDISATCKVIVEKATAVEETQWSDVTIAPNPFNTYIRIYSSEIFSYALFNVQGLLMLNGNATNTYTELATSSLPKGIYLLQLRTTNGASKVYKVIKQ